MQVEGRTLGEPAADQLSLVGAVVVQDEVYVQFRGHVVLEGVEKAAEFAGAVRAMQLAQHMAAGHVEGGEQTGGAVALVVVRAAFDLPGAQGQQRRGAVQCLNLALLVHTQHQGAVGRVQVEADDIADFVDEQRIAAQLKGLAAVRLERKSAPDAADAALAEPGGLGEGAGGPVRGSGRLAFQGAGQHAFHRGIAQAARRARTGVIEQSVEAEKDKTLPPFANRGPSDPYSASDLGVTPPLGAQQHDARPQGQSLRRLGTTRPM